jgi:hypothetical protein
LIYTEEHMLKLYNNGSENPDERKIHKDALLRIIDDIPQSILSGFTTSNQYVPKKSVSNKKVQTVDVSIGSSNDENRLGIAHMRRGTLRSQHIMMNPLAKAIYKLVSNK